MDTENNKILEITQLVQDKAGLENDFTQVMEMLHDKFQKKYVNKLYSVVGSEQDKVNNHPPKEVKLLRALKDFTPEEGKSNIDRIIEMMMFMNTARNMQGNIHTLTQSNTKTLHQMSNGEPTADMKKELEAQAAVEQSAQITELLLTLALMKKI